MENQTKKSDAVAPTAQEEAVKLVGELSASEILDLKKKYPAGLYSIAVKGHIAYFRRPTRPDLRAAMIVIATEGPLDYTESLLTESYVAGSRALIDDDNYFFSAQAVAEQMLESEKATLVKL